MIDINSIIQKNNIFNIIDNLSNSKEEVVSKIEGITGKNVKFYRGDVRDKELLTKGTGTLESPLEME